MQLVVINMGKRSKTKKRRRYLQWEAKRIAHHKFETALLTFNDITDFTEFLETLDKNEPQIPKTESKTKG